VVVLRRAVKLVDEAARGKRGRDRALLSLLDRMGLTPAGRLRLQWLVPTTPAVPAPVVALAPRSADSHSNVLERPRSNDPREPS
jgi:hypothetical protein